MPEKYRNKGTLPVNLDNYGISHGSWALEELLGDRIDKQLEDPSVKIHKVSSIYYVDPCRVKLEVSGARHYTKNSYRDLTPVVT